MLIGAIVKESIQLIIEIKDLMRVHHRNSKLLQKIIERISQLVAPLKKLSQLKAVDEENRELFEGPLRTLQQDLNELKNFTLIFTELLSRTDFLSYLYNVWNSKKYADRMLELEDNVLKSRQALADILTFLQYTELEQMVLRMNRIEEERRNEASKCHIEKEEEKWRNYQKEQSLIMSCNPDIQPLAGTALQELMDKIAFIEGQTRSLLTSDSSASTVVEHISDVNAQEPKAATSNQFEQNTKALPVACVLNSNDFSLRLRSSSKTGLFSESSRRQLASQKKKVPNTISMMDSLISHSENSADAAESMTQCHSLKALSNPTPRYESTKLINMGLYKLTGAHGTIMNRTQGMALLTRDANMGEVRAMYNLGIAYEKGYTEDGIPNLVKALEWYSNAQKMAPRKHIQEKIRMITDWIASISETDMDEVTNTFHHN